MYIKCNSNKAIKAFKEGWGGGLSLITALDKRRTEKWKRKRSRQIQKIFKRQIKLSECGTLGYKGAGQQAKVCVMN